MPAGLPGFRKEQPPDLIVQKIGQRNQRKGHHHMGDNGRVHPCPHRNIGHPHRKYRHRMAHIQSRGTSRQRQNAVHHARLLRDQRLHHIVGVVAVKGSKRCRPVKLEAQQEKEDQPHDACFRKQTFHGERLPSHYDSVSA